MIIRFIVGIIFLSLVLVGSIILFGRISKNSTLPQYEGVAEVNFLKRPVQIYRDSFDLSHVYAETDADAYYGLGYVQAQERMAQMDITRRIGAGKLSEILGERALQVDRWARTIGFSRIALQMWNAASQQTRSYLAAYTNGVNDYISSHRGKFGFEFDGLAYEPEYWKPTDCMIIGRLMSWEMNFSFWNDAAFADIAAHIDKEHLRSLFPGFPDNAPTVYFNHAPVAAPVKDTTVDSIAINGISDLQSVYDLIRDPFGFMLSPPSAGGGSNTVALSPQKTTTKAAMLENDMHLMIGAPARWYITHLHSNQGLSVAGFTVPGLPLILSGRNDDISWGLTNGMIDECDYFTVSREADGKTYRSPSGPKPIHTQKEFIYVKTTNPDYPLRIDTLSVESCEAGVIVNGLPTFRLAKMVANTPTKSVSDELTSAHSVAVQWNGLYTLSDELGAFFKMHHAKSISDATAYLRDFATPCLNISLAEARSGDIAYRVIGRLPIRNGSEERVLLPRDASKSYDLWQGFANLESIASTENPSTGYLVSANNPAFGYRAIPMGENWEPPHRAERLVQLVSTAKKISRSQLQGIVTDISSPFEYNELRPSILQVYHNKFDSLLATDLVTHTALEYVEDWDGVQDSNDISTAILQVYLNRLIVNALWDELGDGLFNEFCYVNNVPVRTIAKLLTQKDNIWWDDIRSPQRENRDDIVRRAFSQTVTWLTNRFGPDVRRWNWGKLHSLTYEHSAAKASPMVAKLVNIEYGRAPGSLTTVMQESYSFWNPFIDHVTPSMRMIADMSNPSLFVSLPTGNAGNVFNPNYRDMVATFKKGELIELQMKGINPSWKKLTLQKKS
ncbi:MAG TPA: penicillin acylase family protein [Candidatus Kapabacteria bacterium]|nr:penicillin acylase family protein [Candidatus Kapabacteria bacterium]